jgi:hypothetical protein
MFSHERFRTLSALAAIGHLSKEEERELEGHLRVCASCSDAREEFAHVVRQFLPQVDGITAAGAETLLPNLTAESRERFFVHARNEGVNLSIEAERAAPVRSGSSFHPRRAALRVAMGQSVQVIGHGKAALSAAALVMIVASSVWLSHIERAAIRAPAAQIARVDFATQNASLREELTTLRAQFVKQASQLEHSQKALAALRESRKKLSDTNKANDDSIAVLRAENQRMAREREDYLIMKEVVDAHLAEVAHELADRQATLERVSQLLTVTPDALKLMGTRKLHIVDVQDFDESGRSVMAFGRIFYAENQAFAFYAFDLSSGGLNPAKSTFTAWGQREAEPYSPRKLGTFEFDAKQSRWVLEVKDPALLAGMD